ncbi:MAG: hypothetical protein ACI8W8_000216 [Rhodothermales bacterium]|jgi:hypothetical protein
MTERAGWRANAGWSRLWFIRWFGGARGRTRGGNFREKLTLAYIRASVHTAMNAGISVNAGKANREVRLCK